MLAVQEYFISPCARGWPAGYSVSVNKVSNPEHAADYDTGYSLKPAFAVRYRERPRYFGVPGLRQDSGRAVLKQHPPQVGGGELCTYSSAKKRNHKFRSSCFPLGNAEGHDQAADALELEAGALID